MPWKKKRVPKLSPDPRLLPIDAYPSHLDEVERDQVDRRLRETLHTIPVVPETYLDNEGDPWTLGPDGAWTDKNGISRSSLYTPIIGAFGPFVLAEEESAATEVSDHV